MLIGLLWCFLDWKVLFASSTDQLTTKLMPNPFACIDGTTQPYASGKLTNSTQAQMRSGIKKKKWSDFMPALCRNNIEIVKIKRKKITI